MAAAATLRRSGGGAATWSRYLLHGHWGRRCFSSLGVVAPPPPSPFIFPSTLVSPSSPSMAPPELRPQIIFPGVFPFGMGSMELMAVPKKKVSRYKKGLRNGPKALKPVPVIVRCKSCGRVKLPHFYCCSGDRGTGSRTESTS